MQMNQTSTTATALTTAAINLGDSVSSIASDYTEGRKGRVIEIDPKKGRARVHWTASRTDFPINIRTWIKFAFLSKI
jgi:transcription antitermination factor NusG